MPSLSEIVAPVAALMRTKKVSFGSVTVSPLIVIAIVVDVAPSAMVAVPLLAT